MRIDIHNVGHGHCSVITCPNGAKVMVDCGYHADPGWYPTSAYAGTNFALVMMTNLDEDHLDDLPHTPGRVTANAILSNPSVTAAALASMKPNGMKPGVRFMHGLLTHKGPGLAGPNPYLGGVTIHPYCNIFGRDFTDTNNLSIAAFVRWGSFTILFAGDLETAGWRALLRVPSFAQQLPSVRVMVASHHGRENGQCEELFRLMKPEVVVFSDDTKQYDSQETDDWYRRRVTGIPDFQNPRLLGGYGRRHVLSTRRDGHLALSVDQAGRYLVTPERLSIVRQLPPPATPLPNLGFPAPTPLWARLT